MALYGQNNPRLRGVIDAEAMSARMGAFWYRTNRVRVRCEHCQMLSINGVACHERGCPNMGSRWDRATESWVKQRQCHDCGSTVDADDPCCSAPSECDVDDADEDDEDEDNDDDADED